MPARISGGGGTRKRRRRSDASRGPGTVAAQRSSSKQTQKWVDRNPATIGTRRDLGSIPDRQSVAIGEKAMHQTAKRERSARRARAVRAGRRDAPLGPPTPYVPPKAGIGPSGYLNNQRERERALIDLLQRTKQGDTLEEKVQILNAADILKVNRGAGVKRRDAMFSDLGRIAPAKKEKPPTADEIDKIHTEEIKKQAKEEKKDDNIIDVLAGSIAPGAGSTKRLSVKGTEEANRRAQQRIAVKFMTANVTEKDIAKALRLMEKRNESPALKVLNQLTRPSSAVAGGVIDASRGKDPISGAVKGFVKNNRSFREITGKGKLGTLAGLALDIGLDPTTYLTFGTARPALEAARRSGQAAANAAKAASPNISARELERIRIAAARETFDSSSAKMRGLRVGARGTPVHVASMLRQLPKAKGLNATERAAAVAAAKKSLERTPRSGPRGKAATLAHILAAPPAAVVRATRVPGARLRSTKLGQAHALSTREVLTSGRLSSTIDTRLFSGLQGKVTQPNGKLDKAAASIFHSYRPAKYDELEWEELRNLSRRYRAQMGTAGRLEEAVFEQYRKELKDHKIPESRHDEIRHAIEIGDFKALKPAEKQIAEYVQRDLKAMHEAEVASGARQADQQIRDRRLERDVPHADPKETHKQVLKEKRTLDRLDRELAAAKDDVAKTQGRAEILSRNVAGRAGETAAESSASVMRRANARVGRTGSARDVLRHIDEVQERGHKYAGGGVGVTSAHKRLAEVEAKRIAAAERLDDARVLHGAQIEMARIERKRAKRADTLDKEAVGYFPRIARMSDEDTPGRRTLGHEPGGTKQAGFTANKRRSERRPLREASEKIQQQFESDIAVAMGTRAGASLRMQALAEMNDTLVGLGRKVDDVDDVVIRFSDDPATAALEAQRFYIRDEHGDMRPVWREVDSAEQIEGAVHRAILAGREVVEIPRQTMISAWELNKRGRPAAARDKKGAVQLGFDEAQRKWKWVVTQPNPGYHVRNIIGDAWNARLGGASSGDIATALKTIAARRDIDGYTRDLARGIAEPLSGKTIARGGEIITLGKAGQMTIAELILGLEAAGAIRMGVVGHELRNARRGVQIKHRTGLQQGIQGVSEAREDVMRMASAIRALKRGEDFDGAAKYANRHHFDYSDLTVTEVDVLRRMLPFYTFMGRNTPLQMAALIMSPGRFANMEKVRDATAEITGLPDDWAEAMPKHIQLTLPFVMPGGPFAKQGAFPMFVTPMIPATDLNSMTPGGLLDKLSTSFTPFAKVPIEMIFKYDTFYRDKIRKDHVPAPDFARNKAWQGSVKGTLGLVAMALGQGMPTFKEIEDPRTGKMVMGWPWWIDRLARQIPMVGAATSVMTEGREKRPGDRQTTGSNYLTGLRRGRIDPLEAQQAHLWDDLDKSESQVAAAKLGGHPHEREKKRLAEVRKLLTLTSQDRAKPYFERKKTKRKKTTKAKAWSDGGW